MRNAYDFDCHEATSFWYVIKDSFSGMEELSSKMRNQVRKSLKTYDVRRISREEFCRVALPVYNAALASYKVKAQLVTQDNIVSTSQGANKEFGRIRQRRWSGGGGSGQYLGRWQLLLQFA